MRTHRILTTALTTTVLALGACVPAQARDFVVTSFDGTRIVGSFFPASGLKAGEQAPTVLSGHGWGGSHSTNPESASAPAGTIGNGPLRHAGYNVLTWDARGFGASGGSAMVDGPDAEARDVQALLDYVAKQPEALDDAPGDPRVGMVGSSYGGGIQLVTAAIDDRIDAIVPDIAWHSLLTSLYKDDTFKAGWGDVLAAAGGITSLAGGLTAPTGPETGSLDPHIIKAFVEGTTLGTLSQDSLNWFGSRGPADAVSRISIPTFLTQGTPDTLFTLQEAITNYGILRANGVQVKMLWHCGGHGVCLTSKGNEPLRIQNEVLTWFRRYLKGDPTADTGPRFEWMTQDGTWHTAPDYPLPAAPQLPVAQGSGTLAIVPGPGSGAAIYASPSPQALTVPVPALPGPTDLVGAPHLDLSYTGTGTGATKVFAQLVDTDAKLVAGNQATPIPVILDGKPHTISRDLEAIALHLDAGSHYELQLIPATTLYREQTAVGTLDVSSAKLVLPAVTIPAATPPAMRLRKAHVTLGLPGSRAAKRGARRLAVRVRVTGQALRTITVSVRDPQGHLIGRAGARNITTTRSRLVTIRLTRAIRRGTYRIGGSYRASSGARGTTARRVRLG